MNDGTVEIVCEGGQEGIDSLVEGIRALERPVEVKNIQATYSDVQGLNGFEVILGDYAQELAEGFGTGGAYMRISLENDKKMLQKQDQMLGKQDQMIDNQGQMLQKQDQMLDKQDQMLDKQDQMLDKQDQMLGKQDQMLGKQDQMLGKQDQVIDNQKQTTGKVDQVIREVHILSTTIKDTFDARLQNLEREVSEIKARLPR